MSINKQALLHAAVKIGAEKWVHIGGGEVITEEYEVDDLPIADHICNCEVVGTSSPKAEFIALANPATVLVLLAELEAAEKRIAALESDIKSANELYENRVPTELAYNQACAAIEKHLLRADNAEAQLTELVAAGIITKVGE